MPRRSIAAVVVALALAVAGAGGVGAQGVPADYVPGELLIKYRPGTSRAARAAIESANRLQPIGTFRSIPVEHVRLADGTSVEAALAALRREPGIEYAEPNYRVHADLLPNDPLFPQMYALQNTGQGGGIPGADIRAPWAWDRQTGDSTLIVGLMDTGADYTHPDLAANLWTNEAERDGFTGIDDDGNGYIDDVHGYDFVHNYGQPLDDSGHGTLMFGVLAAHGDNGEGVVGVAWRARIVVVKFLDSARQGTVLGAVHALEYAVAAGARLSCNAWSTSSASLTLRDAIDAAGSQRHLLVVAAGNDGRNIDLTPSYPASFDTPYVLAVAATTARDSLASFSNYGPIAVDLAAPGENLVSTALEGAYATQSGTSLAAASVTGACALVMSEFPAFDNLQVRDQMLHATDPLPALAGRVATGGRLNAATAVAGPDIVPPGAIADLEAYRPDGESMWLRWTAPGDDGTTGRAQRYDIRVSTAPITEDNFASATPGPVIPASPSGARDSAQVTGLTFSTTYYFAVKAVDDYENRGPISNPVAAATLGPPDIFLPVASAAASVVTGGVRTRTLTVENHGPGTLTMRFGPPHNTVPPAVVSQGPARAKGEAGVPGPPVLERAGGPDAFGYRWADSDEPGGPVFGWVDISTVGTLQPLTGDDALSEPVPMGLSFPFYGGAFDQVRISTNGFLSFTDLENPFSNDPLPSVIGVENMVAPFWADLDVRETAKVYTHNDGSRFIVSWVDTRRTTLAVGLYTFQVLLYPSGEIRYQYLSMESPLDIATIGIQNATRTIGLTVAHQTSYVRNGLAVRFQAAPSWLSATPDSLRVPSGQQGQMTLHFDGSGLPTGFFDAGLSILSNDPDESDVPVTARLHVVGAPNIGVAPAVLDVDSVSVAAVRTATLTVSNSGVRDLVITNVTSDRPDVSAAPTAFTVHPGLAQPVQVRFAPTAPGPLDGHLTLWNNDPDAAARRVAVTGIAYLGPRMVIAPESLHVDLRTNEVVTRTLTVSNAGGIELIGTAAPVLPTAARAARATGVDREVAAAIGPMPKGASDRVFGPTPLRAGGPDDFGYTYKDSDEPGGPAFGWIDVRSFGTLLGLAQDDSTSAPIPIGFAFPFYGAYFDSIRISTNGFLSFTSGSSEYVNTPLPSAAAGVPENLLAAFWDDLTLGGSPRIWTYTDGTQFVAQYQDVPRVGETSQRNTFEVVIYPDGRILYQYLAINTTVRNSNTVGIQNAARDDGLQVSFNANYLKNGLAVRFRPPLRFLGVAPGAFGILPAEHADLGVSFSAQGLGAGVYTGTIRLESNDEVQPTRDVPCVMTVTGVPDIEVSPPALAFGRVFTGYSRTLELRVTNLGSTRLSVTAIESSDPAYSPDSTHLDVPAHDERVLHVRFAPLQARDHPATLTLTSNDPDSPTRLVPLGGEGVPPPVAHVTPASITVALASTLGPEARTARRPVVIENSGGSDLHWTATATSLVGAPVKPDMAFAPPTPESTGRPAIDARGSAPLDVEPPKGVEGVRGGPVTASSGGPDEFGYAWDDSDQPEGPAFVWVDLTASGTRIPFSRDDENSGPIALPFGFPFYGNVFDSVRVCGNGWLSFTSRDSAYHNVTLPNAGLRVPENLIAPFWEDLDLHASGAVYHHYDGQRFIVSFVAVPHWIHQGPPPGVYSFQVLLYPGGEIHFQYLDVEGIVDGATIGIQNATKDVGLQVVANAAYVHDALRVRIQRRSYWLRVAADSGVTAPGTRDTLGVLFDATGLADGDYQGRVDVATNDPLLPAVTIPVSLHVGVVVGSLAFDPDHRDNEVFTGRVAARVTTPGCAPQAIVPSTVRALGNLPIAPGSTAEINGCDATFEFARRALLGAMPDGAESPIEVIGELAGVTWFVTRDTISMLRPVFSLPEGEIPGGQEITLTWSRAPGSPPCHFDLWQSVDGGVVWSPVALDRADTSYAWTAPSTPTAGGWLELIAHADPAGTFVGSTFAGPFSIGAQAIRSVVESIAPLRSGLRYAGSNPARGSARLELSLARRGAVDVRVYDVRGGLVRRLAAGEREAGVHALEWDGRDETGRAVGPGMYFARAAWPGGSGRVRFALVR